AKNKNKINKRTTKFLSLISVKQEGGYDVLYNKGICCNYKINIKIVITYAGVEISRFTMK
ncbi:MAG: hypothetical protein ACKPER_07375, partial [Dolichospermum sp.]